LLLDRPLQGGGVEVTFFGRRTSLPEGPARFALRSGAAVGVAAFPRPAKGRPEVAVLAEFAAPSCFAGPDAVRKLTQWMAAAHERYIRRYPDQWYMFRDMWPDAP
jgi:KDO2-lipid IV(A) lauroyltransferase